MSDGTESRVLNDCGCCETTALDYPAHFNRPGLDALAYRLATHGGFLERMFARLTRDQLPAGEAIANLRPLAALTTRDAADPTVALLDAWAVVADVLTFYQERIANEGFLRTATERRSVLELARAIGYELKPGVAASTVLAFTADGAKGSPPQVTVPKGTRVLSIPKKDELPQTFETIEEIIARPEWNALEHYAAPEVHTDAIAYGTTQLRLKGTATGLRAGDGLLIVGDERMSRSGDEHWDFRVLDSVQSVADKGYTLVRWTLPLGHQHPPPVGPAQRNPRVYAFRLRPSLFGHNAPEWDTLDVAIKLRYAPASIESVLGAAFRPSGAMPTRAVSASSDGVLRLWDLDSAKPLAASSGHIGAVNAAAYSPDGKYFVSGGADGSVRVWDAASGGLLQTWSGHKGMVPAVACGQYTIQETQTDGSTKTKTIYRIVSGGADTNILVWDLESGTALRTLSGHSGAVTAVALLIKSSTEQWLVSGGADGIVKVWRPELGTLSATLANQGVAVNSLALAARADGAHVVAAGHADGKLRRWRRPAGAGWSELSSFTTAHSEAALSVALTSNGTKLLCGEADGTLELWDWDNAAVTRVNHAHDGPIHAVAWSGNGARVLSGGADRKLVLRNSALTLLKTLAARPPDQVNEWPDFDLKVNPAAPALDLDSVYPAVLPGSWVVLARTGYTEVYRVEATDVRALTGFSLSAKVTRLTLDSAEHLSWFGRRNTVIYAQSEVLERYSEELPDRQPVAGNTLDLSQIVQGLEPGRSVVVSGQRMRARILDATKLSLVSADGYSSRDVDAGDTLVCLAPPLPDRADYSVTRWRAQGDGFVAVAGAPLGQAQTLALRWSLRDRNGFEGYLTTTLRRNADGSFEETQILALRPADAEENKISEVAVLERVTEVARARSRLHFSAPLANLYDRESLRINANVAAATHGETVSNEVLGSGDGTTSNARFTLRKKPLTYVAAANATGGESTLEVRVNDVLWEEAASLYELDARSQSYVVRRDNDGNSTVIFGDGMRGARLPTGQENVKATYRAGLGPDGMVAAGALTLLQTKPLGIREVVNPVAADGAAAPEALEDARAHAPLTVLTLDRIVSLKDYEDFAAAFAGVGKAQVSALWTGITHLVHLTVAAADGTPVTTSSALYANLVAAVQRLRDPATPVQVAGYALLHFKLAAQVCVDASYLRERVEQDIRAALAAKFAFAARAFGQQVTLAEVVTVIQSVAGVVAVNVTRLHYVDHVPAEGEAPAERLNAARANWDAASGRAAPAQLLLLYPGDGGVELPEMPP